MLFSRAIRLRNLRQGESLALVPYADLINHSCFSQAYIDAREAGDWLFKTGEEEVILYADRGYRRMEQVCCMSVECIVWFVSYNAHSVTIFRFTFRMDQSQMPSSYSCMALQSREILSTRWMSLFLLHRGRSPLSRRLPIKMLRSTLWRKKRLNFSKVLAVKRL